MEDSQADKSASRSYSEMEDDFDISQAYDDDDSDMGDDSGDDYKTVAEQDLDPVGQHLADIPITRLQDRYEFLTVIGSGGAGVIYKARQMPLGKMVAVKMVHSHVMSATAIKRFHKEAKTISTLSHPNLISVFDFGVSEEKQPFMVMDFVEGTPLSSILDDEGRLPPDLVGEITKQICDGLTHAHVRGILHRDLKPSNVMIITLDTGATLVKILDFGLAKLLTGDGIDKDHLTKTGETVGTPAFMSPEQVMGRQTDHRSDLYSVGCLMYQCLTGEPPFVGDTRMETMLMQLNQKPLPINVPGAEQLVPPAMESIVLKLLEKKADDRFQSMIFLKDALDKLDSAASAPPEVLPVTTKPAEEEKKKTPERLSSPENQTIGSGSAPAKTMPLYIVALVSLILGGAAVGAFFHLQNRGGDSIDTKSTNSPARQKVEKATAQPSVVDPSYSDAEFVDDQFQKRIDKNVNATTMNSDGLEISDFSLRSLGRMKRLSYLSLENSPVTDRGLKFIEHLPIKNLVLRNTKVTDAGMARLLKFQSLVYLDISGTPVTDAGLEILAKKGSLTTLIADDTSLDDQAVELLSEFSSLNDLSLAGSAVTDAGVSAIARLAHLEVLNLSNTKIGDNGVKALTTLSHLKSLKLAGTKITGTGVEYLVAMPSLLSLDLSNTALKDDSIELLCKMQGLNKLNLLNCSISRKAIMRFQRLSPRCFLTLEPTE